MARAGFGMSGRATMKPALRRQHDLGSARNVRIQKTHMNNTLDARTAAAEARFGTSKRLNMWPRTENARFETAHLKTAKSQRAGGGGRRQFSGQHQGREENIIHIE